MYIFNDQRARLATILALITFCTLFPVHAQLKNRGNVAVRGRDSIAFGWSFVEARPRGKAGYTWRCFYNDTVLTSGTHLKFYFVPQTKCYVYLFAQWSEGNIEMLLPSSITELGKPAEAGKAYSYPANWVQLDSAIGKETFYLLVSDTALTKLEDAYRSYAPSPAAQKPSIGKRLIKEIKDTRAQAFREKAMVSTPPVEIGGNVRGIREDLNLTLKEIGLYQGRARGIYSRRIVLTHTH